MREDALVVTRMLLLLPRGSVGCCSAPHALAIKGWLAHPISSWGVALAARSAGMLLLQQMSRRGVATSGTRRPGPMQAIPFLIERQQVGNFVATRARDSI